MPSSVLSMGLSPKSSLYWSSYSRWLDLSAMALATPSASSSRLDADTSMMSTAKALSSRISSRSSIPKSAARQEIPVELSSYDLLSLGAGERQEDSLEVWERLVEVVELLRQRDGVVGRFSVLLGKIYHAWNGTTEEESYSAGHHSSGRDESEYYGYESQKFKKRKYRNPRRDGYSY
ncbi:hypothetical protein EYF80_047622 [Liparis tanakae]|uniref:Uncharacterized protein n=1 Tax=Liparis tanakae TaxID=230148 RepID=A0A4Z2FLR1_9TELE|nr:hypothetical protein EYF80_047622 [Liparis tanakae]